MQALSKLDFPSIGAALSSIFLSVPIEPCKASLGCLSHAHLFPQQLSGQLQFPIITHLYNLLNPLAPPPTNFHGSYLEYVNPALP